VPQLSPRGAALAALQRWRTKEQLADSIISELLGQMALPPADRAFALELFYGALRNLTLLDFWIRALRPSHIDVDLRDILRLGLYQLFVLGTSEHAAVYETVELAPRRQRPIINGILRSAVRRKEELSGRASMQPLDIRTSHPKFLTVRWQQQFGTEAVEALCAWNNRPPPTYARINQLKIDQESFLQTYPELNSLTNISNFVKAHSVPSAALECGHCYIQDPSTAIACEFLGPVAGENVLDACAAPGGKTGYLAELMQNRGLIVACDREPTRVRLLKKNLARLGVQIAKIVCHDWTQVTIPQEIRSKAPFDRILLDAPCSNTGVMRRRVDVRWRLTPADFARMRERQIEIILGLIPLLKRGGVLVYSTCSLELEENEEVVQHLLTETSILRLDGETRTLPFRDNFDGAFATKFSKID